MNTKPRIELIDDADMIPENTVDFNKRLIGQPEVAMKLMFFVESHSKETPIPTMLFSGSQGLGKTFTSHMVAEALGRKMIEINCGGLSDREQLFDDILLTQVHGDVPVTLLFDEAHKMPREVATELLTMTNPNDDFCNVVDYKNCDIVFDMKKINIILATTDANMLLRPLVNRCEEIYFNLYSHSDLQEILEMYLGDCSIKASKSTMTNIGYACRGRARTAFLLAQNIKRFCHREYMKTLDVKSKTLKDEGWQALSKIFGIHPLGLNNKEIKLLKTIKEFNTLSCSNLAIKLGVTEDNIKDEWEQRPKELGLIKSTSKGRSLTNEGIKYMEKYNI